MIFLKLRRKIYQKKSEKACKRSRKSKTLDQKNTKSENSSEQKAKETDINADLVVPVPDSGVPAALGYSEYSNKKFELGLIRNHYVGRTFIEPTQNIRSLGVKLKLSSTNTIVKNNYIKHLTFF